MQSYKPAATFRICLAGHVFLSWSQMFWVPCHRPKHHALRHLFLSPCQICTSKMFSMWDKLWTTIIVSPPLVKWVSLYVSSHFGHLKSTFADVSVLSLCGVLMGRWDLKVLHTAAFCHSPSPSPLSLFFYLFIFYVNRSSLGFQY